jgi:opacity protein-like surface antigen
MKRILTILSFVSIGTGTSIYAQYNCDWGIEGGPNLSNFIVTDNPNVNPEPAIFGSTGFTFQYNTKKILSFRTGFSYQRKGYRLNDLLHSDVNGNTPEKARLTSRFDYITLPLLVKASFGKKVQFFVNAGPYVGYLLAKSDKLETEGGKTEISRNQDIEDFLRWDFGIAGGLGITVPIKENWLISMEARNYYGLININSSAGSKIHTNTTDLRIGVAYRMGGRDSD